jgi:hypothetical protein
LSDEWKNAWQPVIDRIGESLTSEDVKWAPDLVEAGAIRRWLEPLEFDCALHDDRQVAQAQGYLDVVAPMTSLGTFAAPRLRSPGSSLFTEADRNAQPLVRSLRPPLPAEAPSVSGYFATDINFEFLRSVTVGERLGRRGLRLVACVPKETKVGRGAFVTFEVETVSSRGDVVSRMRYGLFCYNPHPEPSLGTVS